MKRILYLIAAAALLMPVACNPADKPDSGSDVKLPAPATREVAQKIEFAATDRLTIDDASGKVIKTVYAIEFADANRAIITTTTPDLSVSGTKALSARKFEVRDFVLKDSKTFEVANFGTVSINDGKVVNIKLKADNRVDVKAADGETFTTDKATITKAAEIANLFMANAARTWKVNSTILEVKTSDGAIKETFTGGCDLPKIAKFAADHGVDALKNKLSQFDGYVVKEILFTGSNSFCISFTGADAFCGSVNMKNDGTFTFNFEDGNTFFNASGTGSVEFTKDGKMNVSVNANIEGYSGTLKMNCSEV